MILTHYYTTLYRTLFLCSLVGTAMTHGTYILFDLSEVLVHQDHAAIAIDLGPLRILRYSLEDQKNPFNLPRLMIETLYLNGKQKPSEDFPVAVSQGFDMPKIWCDLLCGSITTNEMLQKVDASVAKAWAKKIFGSSLERDLVQDLLRITFDPTIISSHIYINKAALKLVKKCYEKTTKQGTRAHTIVLVANWEAESFALIRQQESIAALLNLFDEKNIFLSSSLGTMKPYKKYFTKVLTALNAQPEECILIDDSLQNLAMAQKMNMQTILVKDKNLKQVEQTLKNLGIL